jgi:hypothetical protein
MYGKKEMAAINIDNGTVKFVVGLPFKSKVYQ